MNAKTCRQCGELKPLNQFRQYYGGRTGTYTTCKACEKINSRLKYLNSKGDDRSEQEDVERSKIYQLYDAQRACGLRPPQRSGRRTELGTDLDDMISRYKPTIAAADSLNAPAELLEWLTCDLTEDPDVYLDVIYDKLVDTYRPVLSIDRTTMIPVRDDKYKEVLDRVLQRFNDYEDKYYEK